MKWAPYVCMCVWLCGWMDGWMDVCGQHCWPCSFWDVIHTCFDGLQWNLDLMMPRCWGTCHPIIDGVKGHLGVIWGQWTLIVKICINGYCINIRWWIFMELGYNDTWVGTHMWPQYMWGCTSCRGHLGSLTFYKSKLVTASTYFDGFLWNLGTMVLE